MPDRPFTLPPSLTEEHAAVVGRTGAGKTFAAKVLVERLLTDHRRICIVDPTGVWHGLRSSADGRRAGFPVIIFGGDHADQPIGEHSGARLAGIIATRNLPCIVDLSEFGIGERHRFMTEFAAELYRLNRLPLHLIVDEADEFMPQNPLPETRRMLSALDRIVRRGRARGFRVLLITQRPAVIHKNVLSQAGAMIAMKLTAPQDRKAVLEWIKGQADEGQGKAVLDTLAGLPRGEGWIWAPADGFLERAQFPPIATFDSSATPDYGDEAAEAVTLADVDTAEIAALLADEGEGADAPAPLASIAPDALAAARAEGYREGFDAGLLKGRADGDRLGKADAHEAAEIIMRRAMDALHHEATVARTGVGKVAPLPDVNFSDHKRGGKKRTIPAEKSSDRNSLPTLALTLLSELHRRHPARFSWTQLATLCRRAARGGQFNAARKALRDAGVIIEAGGLVQARDAPGGQALAAPETAAEILDGWCGKLPAMPSAMLRALAETGEPIDKLELAQRIGREPRGGQFNSGLATLRRNELITEAGGRMVAAPELRS